MINRLNRNAQLHDYDASGDAGSSVDTTVAARRAARQAGMSLNSWINQVVSQKALALGLDEDDLDEDERMDAIVEKLTRLNLRGGRQMPRSNRRAAMLPEDMDDAPRAAAPVLGRVLERLESLENRLGNTKSAKADNVFENALSRIEQRLNALDNAARRPAAETKPANKDVFATIEAKLQALNASLDRSAAPRQPAESRPAAAPFAAEPAIPPAPAFALAPKFEPQAPQSFTPALDERFFKDAFERESRAFDGLHAEIAKLAEQMHDLRRPQPDNGIANLQRDLAGMAKILAEMAPRQSLSSLETRIDTLIESLHHSRPENLSGSLATPLHEMRTELRRMVSETDPRGNISALEGEVRHLARKVAELENAGFDHVAFAELQAQTAEMRQLLQKALARPQTHDALERQVSLLADRIEHLSLSGQTAAHAGEVVAAIDEIRDLVDRRLAGNNVEALERQMQDLTARIDLAMAHSAAPAPVMAAPSVDMSALEAMLEMLTAKIDAARGPGADAHAFAALEQQINTISTKFDNAETSGKHFKSLQNSITDLFAHLEETRSMAQQAAETASHAIATRPAEESPPHVDALSQDMGLLLRAQEAADRRANQTMGAVHATLEKIVGRLASLEDEVLEVRRQPAPSSFAPISTPAFARPAAPRAPEPTPEHAWAKPAQAPEPEAPAEMMAIAEPVLPRAPRVELPSVPVEQAVLRNESAATRAVGDDFLLEPGKGFTPPRRAATDSAAPHATAPHAAAPAMEPVVDDTPANKAEFIAAARRAAQAAAIAAQSQIEDSKIKSAKPASKDFMAIGRASTIDRLRQFAEERKRPLLLGLAGIMVAFLGVQVYGALMGESEAPVAKAPVTQAPAKIEKSAAPVENKAAPQPAPAEAKPAVAPMPEVKPAVPQAAAPAPQTATPAPQATAPAPQTAAPAPQPQAPAPAAKPASPPASFSSPPSAVPPNVRQGNPLSLPTGPKAMIGGQNNSFLSLNAPAATAGFGKNQPAVIAQGFNTVRTNPALAARKIDMMPLGATAPQPEQVAPADVVPAPSTALPPAPKLDGASQAAQKPMDLNPPAATPAPTLAAPSAAAVPVAAAPTLAIAPKLPNPAIIAPTPAGAGTVVDAALLPASAGLKAAANAGNPAAEYELGVKYADGRGETRDFKAAAALFEKAATQNLAPAQYRLGALYEKGLGVPRDLAQAKALYKKAADLGNPRAMHNLAVLTAEGTDGHPDYANALVWFKKAAEFGVRDSQFNLGILTARGLGQPADMSQAYLWFAVAAQQGDEDAAKKRDEVGLRLDAQALESAKAAVAAFNAKKADPLAVDVVAPAGGWDATTPKVENRKLPALATKAKLS